jgi:MoaA/NifB/PqqE/SkfB family radical SAM enzyme
MHKKIAQAMKNLKEVGVPFGISVTATKNNAETAVSDELMKYYFDECGAVYGWIFQIMPIGRAKGLDLMVSPEQRLAMYRRTQHLIKDRKLFIADFWNSAPVTDGCISAGKPGGYFYIEWNGNVTPCVFNPYSPVNINDVYKKGGNLNDVFRNPFFESIRKWQKEYALDRKPEEMGDLLAPCPVKDHYCVMKSLLDEYRTKPIDPAAKEALEDFDYQKGMEKYGEKVIETMEPVWQKEYLGKSNE